MGAGLTADATGFAQPRIANAISDGDMRVLDGFGVFKQMAAPRRTGGSTFNVVTPTKPMVVANQTLVRLDGETFVFSEARGAWDPTHVTSDVDVPLTGDQRGVLKDIKPGRLVTIRIIEQVLGEIIVILLDEHLGMPILAVGNIRTPLLRRDWSELVQRHLPADLSQRRVVLGLRTEWHPEGYMPAWLQPMNPMAK
jgi:hypothetical protein